jgi:putative CocE/NonD family hydrolase
MSRRLVRVCFALLSMSIWIGSAASPVAAQQPAAAASAPSAAAKPDAAKPEYRAEVDVMVPMRDGVKLATDLYFPADYDAAAQPAAKLPVLLVRTPYGKGNGNSGDGKYFAPRGYVVVVQDTRGRYRSEGVWRWLTDDLPDGFDCAEWIVKQPWSNGRIGMLGTSYVGGTQHAMALSGSPHLKTLIPVDAVSNMGRQSMRNAGAFEMRFWNWIILNAANGSSASKDPGKAAVLKEMAANRHEYLKLLPLRAGTTPLKLAPEYESWLIDAMRHGADDEFWSAINVVERADKYADVPVYLVGGWYDSWAGNTTANFQALTKQLKSGVYLIMGPWIHGAQGSSAHGQVNFGKEAAIADPQAWRLQWFDRWLKDATNDVGRADPFKTKVRIFVMGTGDGTKDDKGRLNHGGSWRDENEWPLKRAVPTKFYFRDQGRLQLEANKERPAEGMHFDSPFSDSFYTRFTFDPRDPVPTIGGNISSGTDIMLQGAWDQRGGPHVWNWMKPIPLSARNDVVVFQSEPLKDDVEVTGEIEVKLFASSTARDTDFTAKLVDVYPPSADFPGGFDLNIGDGIVRARFRDGLKNEKLIPSTHDIHSFTIKIYPTSNVFKKGHRIRVDISSSNFPRFDVNPNTGEPLGENRNMTTCNNAIRHCGLFDSHILLPIVPRAKQAAVAK